MPLHTQIQSIADAVIANARNLPAAEQVRLILALADELSFSNGADRIVRGCEMIEADLWQETHRVEMGSYARECVL